MSLLALGWRSAVQARFVLISCLTVLAGLQLVIVGQAAAYEETHAFGRMAELVPGFLQRGLGSKSLLLVTFKGTVAFGYFHPVIAILISVLAIYFMTEPAHEVEAGLVDLTLARSLPRHMIVTRSVLMSFGTVSIAVVLMAFGTRLGLVLFGSPEFDAPSMAVTTSMLAHLAAVAACFGGLGLVIATGSRRWSTAFTAAAMAAVVLYLLDFLAIAWRPAGMLAWLSPYHYYPALSIIVGDAPPVRNLVILLSATACFVAIGYWRFSRRDL